MNLYTCLKSIQYRSVYRSSVQPISRRKCPTAIYTHTNSRNAHKYSRVGERVWRMAQISHWLLGLFYLFSTRRLFSFERRAKRGELLLVCWHESAGSEREFNGMQRAPREMYNWRLPYRYENKPTRRYSLNKNRLTLR